jgi:hypothetical protein
VSSPTPGPAGRRTVETMDDNDRTARDRALRVQLEVELDREPISGRLRPERGAEEPFVGWLGFVEALRRLDDAANERSSEDDD